MSTCTPTPRGGESNAMWATTPVNGLVYMVVHDPPGGLSYAEVNQVKRCRLTSG